MDGRLSRRGFLRVGGLAAMAAAAGLGVTAVPALADTVLPPEDGYELWLRYRLVDDAKLLQDYRGRFAQLVVQETTPVMRSARDELSRALRAMLGQDVPVVSGPTASSALVIGTWTGSAAVRQLVTRGDVERAGDEGYRIRLARDGDRDVVVVASMSERGVLYGAFSLLRRLQRRQPLAGLDVVDRPKATLRLVDHWDNLNGTVERGYAGGSIFTWNALPALDPRYTDYARALASVGVNGTIVNNVNADPAFLTGSMIDRLASLAGVLRSWGLRLYLSANFAEPLALRELGTADPLDARVQKWWQQKADEIYTAIPDFGGFLVKANSEGQPGPSDYGRTHAEGANMLARALAPHGGIIMWRTFVYDSVGDVATDAYNAFAPLDGQFDDNVVLQTKYGPIDFQVREAVHPLFGAMPQTNMMIELQITQEYTGHETDLCYLPVWWKQVLDFDTHARGDGTTVAEIINGSAFGYSHSGSAGVINFGNDRNWTGSHLAAANTHGYGRLLWDPKQQPDDLATEWIEMTFGTAEELVRGVGAMLMSSWHTYENYTSPLGVGPMVDQGPHYYPDPAGRLDYHRSDQNGTGDDRTVATGSGVAGMYHEPWRDVYESVSDCPDELLLFFHHVPYTHRLHSGRTVIDHIYESHFAGLETVHGYRDGWRKLSGLVDERRHADVLATFDAHIAHATLWRDTIVGYYFRLSRLLGTTREWVQVEVTRSAGLLLGGWPTRVPMQVGNASSRDRTISAHLDAPDGWQARTTGVQVATREFESLTITVVPPVAGLDTSLDVDVRADDLPVLGATGVGFTVTPAPALCHLALDGGSASSPVFAGYTRLSPQDAWDPARGFGWVGGAPQSRDRGASFDALRRDFCNDNTPRVLRVAVPAGTHDAYLLVGDAAVGSEPTIVRSGGTELGRTGELGTDEFGWLRFPLDGGSTGRPVDLELSAPSGAHWHLVAFAIVDETARPPAVVVGEAPAELVLLPDEPTSARFWLYNFTSSDVTVQPRVTVPDGYTAVLAEPSITVPGGGDREIALTVTRAAATSAAGTLTFALDGDSHAVPLRPDDNWIQIADLTASSTHSPSAVTNLQDGNTDSSVWGGGGLGGWNDDTPNEWPDTVTATWPHPVRLGRVRLYTLNSPSFPASKWGVRDVDVQISTSTSWVTVAQVRGNTAGVIDLSFTPADTDRLRIAVLDSNDHTYSRLIEIAAYTS